MGWYANLRSASLPAQDSTHRWDSLAGYCFWTEKNTFGDLLPDESAIYAYLDDEFTYFEDIVPSPDREPREFDRFSERYGCFSASSPRL